MDTRCFVQHCPSVSGGKLALFQTPKEPEMLAKWQKAIPGITDTNQKYGKTLGPKHRVCERHFSPDDVWRPKDESTHLGFKPWLKYEAVPSVFPSPNPNLQKDIKAVAQKYIAIRPKPAPQPPLKPAPQPLITIKAISQPVNRPANAKTAQRPSIVIMDGKTYAQSSQIGGAPYVTYATVSPGQQNSNDQPAVRVIKIPAGQKLMPSVSTSLLLTSAAPSSGAQTYTVANTKPPLVSKPNLKWSQSGALNAAKPVTTSAGSSAPLLLTPIVSNAKSIVMHQLSDNAGSSRTAAQNSAPIVATKAILLHQQDAGNRANNSTGSAAPTAAAPEAAATSILISKETAPSHPPVVKINLNRFKRKSSGCAVSEAKTDAPSGDGSAVSSTVVAASESPPAKRLAGAPDETTAEKQLSSLVKRIFEAEMSSVNETKMTFDDLWNDVGRVKLPESWGVHLITDEKVLGRMELLERIVVFSEAGLSAAHSLPVTLKRLYFREDLRYEITVTNTSKKLTPSHLGITPEVPSTIADLEDAISTFAACRVCAGGPPSSPVRHFEPEIATIDETGVWRHRLCHSLATNGQRSCPPCRILRPEQSVAHPTDEPTIVHLRKELRASELRVARLRARRTRQRTTLNCVIGQHLRRLRLAPARRLVLDEILSAADATTTTTNRLSGCHSPRWLQTCLSILAHGPATYKFLRRRHILPLPSIKCLLEFSSRQATPVVVAAASSDSPVENVARQSDAEKLPLVDSDETTIRGDRDLQSNDQLQIDFDGEDQSPAIISEEGEQSPAVLDARVQSPAGVAEDVQSSVNVHFRLIVDDDDRSKNANSTNDVQENTELLLEIEETVKSPFERNEYDKTPPGGNCENQSPANVNEIDQSRTEVNKTDQSRADSNKTDVSLSEDDSLL